MTTLLVDYNNIAMMRAFHQEVEIESESPNYNMWEFLVFETIYDYIRKFKNITEVVIAKDDKKYWRKSYFKRYKENRKIQREKKNIDWDTFHKYINKLFNIMRITFPFKCINISYCEADDIIGYLALTLNKNIIILSSDKDYKQVLNKKIRAYSPYTQKFLECKNPQQFLIESCLKGQAKDSILNVITPEDWPIGMRKPGFGVVKCKKWIDTGLDIMLNKTIKYKKDDYKTSLLPIDRYNRNMVLMDFKKIPKTLSTMIEEVYNNYKLPEMNWLFEYFQKKNWTRFINEYEITENKLLTLY